MQKTKPYGMITAGTAAGIINGLFGAGGGMVLIPLLTALTDLEESELFSSSLAIMLPICIISLWVTALHGTLPFMRSIPYLIGGTIGGLIGGILQGKLPTLWLHRILGLLIIWGGIRYL